MPVALLVADSGPLIALSRLKLLHLPKKYFEQVFVTASVWDEVMRKPSAQEGEEFGIALRAGMLEVVGDPEEIPAVIAQARIDQGEHSAIALGISIGATLLIDDRRARMVAKDLKLPVIGTLALLIRAREDGYVSTLRPLLDHLRATGYFVSDELVRHVLDSLGE